MNAHQRTYYLLVAIILLTLPCYCVGIVLFALAPDAVPLPPPIVTATPSTTPDATTVQTPVLPTPIPTITRLATQTPAGPTATLPPTNLPAQLNRLIGRETEVALVGDLLRQPDIRLITLTGPGGTGKTRLALQVAAEMQPHFADGVYFVDLSPLADPNLVATTLAGVLKIDEAAGEPLPEQLIDALHPRQLLLVLDNFEQIVAAAVA